MFGTNKKSLVVEGTFTRLLLLKFFVGRAPLFSGFGFVFKKTGYG
jgi:hypothetical protein